MKAGAWQGFCAVRERFRALCASAERKVPELRRLQQELANGREGPAYESDDVYL